MTHYGQIFTINRQQFMVKLGYYDEERATPQLIEVDVRLYFAGAPDCARTDQAPFIDYAIIIDEMKKFIVGKEFQLIEYLATEFFKLTRAVLDTHGQKDIKLWLRLNKANAPIEHLAGGACYVLSDLPAGATFPPAA